MIPGLREMMARTAWGEPGEPSPHSLLPALTVLVCEMCAKTWGDRLTTGDVVDGTCCDCGTHGTVMAVRVHAVGIADCVEIIDRHPDKRPRELRIHMRLFGPLTVDHLRGWHGCIDVRIGETVP